MEKAERDRILGLLNQGESNAYSQILQEIRSDAKTLAGGQIYRMKKLMAQRLEGLPPNVQSALNATGARDQIGPKEDNIAPDFNFKRVSSEEKVKLSSFKYDRPVGLIFGSYT